MAVPEPPSDFGLWPQVKAVTGWPESNEDLLHAAAQTWDGAAGDFESAGRTDATAVRAAWGDGGGDRYRTRLASVTGAAEDTGADMRRLATYTSGAATIVATAKTSISQVIEQNAPSYGLAGLLPPGVRAAVQPAIIGGVVRIVLRIIQQAAKAASKGPKAKPPPRPAPRAPVLPRGVKEGWVSGPARNGKGTVWQRPGPKSHPDADSMRIMDPTPQYPHGYVRFYNQHGQPIGLNGKPNVPKADSHIPIGPDGSYPLPAGW